MKSFLKNRPLIRENNLDMMIDPILGLPKAITITNPCRPIVNRNTRVGRNDDCPCGSGKHFKKCCGKE